jgi:hypothetical protein
MSECLSRWQSMSHGVIFVLMLAASVILIATDDNVGLLIGYLSIIFVGFGLPVWLVGRRLPH